MDKGEQQGRTKDSSTLRKRPTLRSFFRTWTPREVVLLAASSVSTCVAAGFAVAWIIDLVPLETVWGSVADWAGVAVTAFGFLVAFLAFYLQFREVAQDDEERRHAEEMTDLGSTAELLQLASTEREAMTLEAALVRAEIAIASEYQSLEGFDGLRFQFEGRIRIINETGKRLTDLELHLPHIKTNIGEWEPKKIRYTDITRTPTKSDRFALGTGIFFGTKSMPNWLSEERQNPDGPKVAFHKGDCRLTFRIENGPRWELVLTKDGNSPPRLIMNE